MNYAGITGRIQKIMLAAGLTGGLAVSSAMAASVSNETNRVAGFRGFDVKVLFMASGCLGNSNFCGNSLPNVCKVRWVEPGDSVGYNFKSHQTSRKVYVCNKFGDDVTMKGKSPGKYHVCTNFRKPGDFEIEKHQCERTERKTE